jgi:hypothetical protein
MQVRAVVEVLWVKKARKMPPRTVRAGMKGRLNLKIHPCFCVLNISVVFRGALKSARAPVGMLLLMKREARKGEVFDA